MTQAEARAKAYFIAARIIESYAEHLPDVFERFAQETGISQDELATILSEMTGEVTDHLRSQAGYYRAVAQRGKNMRRKP